MFWEIRSFPKCDYHVFLSHSGEDRLQLVDPIRVALESHGIIPWFDQTDYYYGRTSRAALRDGVLKSRHTVFFITDALLASPRGWCVMELTFSEILQANLMRPGGPLANPILPLFLVPHDDPRINRSVWQDLRDRGKFIPANTVDHVGWCLLAIRAFLVNEQKLSRDIAKTSRSDPAMKSEIEKTPGLLPRITKFHPGAIRD
ncbi:MAG: toll/interleukin-1 receptor domain-containing protein [Fimbriiglobus sp.]